MREILYNFQTLLTFLYAGVILICSVHSAVLDDEYEDLYTMTVEHSFDRGPDVVYTRKGTITIQSLRTGAADFFEDSTLTSEQKNSLRELAASDGVYRIRVSKGTDRENQNAFVYSFLKACALYESRLSDKLTIHVDHSGNLISVSIMTHVPYCRGHVEILDHELTRFNTTVDVQQTVVGPAPETQAYIQKLEQEKIEKAKGQQADNRSFFAKYWMYIVPMLIFVMMSQSLNQNAQGGGE